MQLNNLLLVSFGEIATYALYVVLAVFILLLHITVHETGHYLSGKILGFKIDEFAVGFGPRLFCKKRRSGEIFSFRLIPLGGFCAFRGEENDCDDKGAFNRMHPFKRIIVLCSGAFFNFVFSLLIILLSFGIYGQNALFIGEITASEKYSVENSLISGDTILTANGKNVYLTTDLILALDGKVKDEVVSFCVIRGGEEQTVAVQLRADANFKNMEDAKKLYDCLGVVYQTDGEQITRVQLYATNVRLGFFRTIGAGFEYSFKLAGTVFGVLGELLTGRIGISSMGGTITTVTMTANAIAVGGLRYLMYIASFIGVNLAVFNLLPIPALDGSKVIFCLIEWIRGKPINRKVETVIHFIGLILIVGFAILVDLQRCF